MVLMEILLMMINRQQRRHVNPGTRRAAAAPHQPAADHLDAHPNHRPPYIKITRPVPAHKRHKKQLI